MNTKIAMRTVLGLVASAGIVASTGCGGRGAYTREGTSLAKEKMNVIKSATEWDMARQAFFAGDLQKALKKVDVSISINPGVAKSHVLRGRIMLEKGEIGHGVRALETALAIDPDNVDANYYMGIASERLAQLEEAFTYYDKASQLDEYSDQYAVAAAEMLMDLKRYDQAKAYLEQTATHDHSAGVRQTLGHLARLLGDLPAAVTEFKSAQLLAPDDPGILEDLTSAQYDSGSYADAAYGYATLLTRKETSDRRDLKATYAKCLIKLDRPMEARKLYKELTQGDRGASHVEAWIGLGNVSYTVGDFTTVKQAATRVVALAPNQKEGYLLWAILHRNKGNIEASINSLNDAIARDPADPILHTMVALGLLELNRTTQARAALGKALALDPDNQSAATVMTMINQKVASVPTSK
jgi:tetratricopeptide (TPR) repeat protein